ncbi:M60 family metallopeptidase [Bacteroides sp. UBA939]|uniref:M60 family metallopeptidase n=1 Tax=Bacteroides sp. UBA939 TaxID=1946092 RepID=UPI0025C5E764|nr:M60 family metallopeptidase [Bacteroides sp. UBA939]
MKNKKLDFTFRTFHFLWIWSLLLCVSTLCVGCSDDDKQLERTDWVRVLPLKLDFPASGGEQSLTLILTKDVDLANLQHEVAANGESWCTVELKDDVLRVVADPTYYEFPRTTLITISYGDLRRDIPVSQSASSGSDDIKIQVASATATTEETVAEQRGIEKSFDGDYESYFNSKFGAFSAWPFIIDYTFKTASKLDYIVYTPRTDNGTRYGAFNEFNVLVATADAPNTWVKVAECARGDVNYNASVIKLEQSVENVQKVRFEIHSAHNNRLSCAEMDFFQVSLNKFDYTTIFRDNSCSELCEGITERDIRKMPGETYKQLAMALLGGTYDKKYRVAEYRPYQDPAIMAASNKTSTYGLRDNPTGIYVNEGEDVLVLVDDTRGQNIAMVVQDLTLGYNSSKTYALREGENKIKVTNGGLIYIMNLTNEAIPLILDTEEAKAAAAAKTVKIHFPFGKVNGYFDIQSDATQQDWEEMLRNSRYKDIDVLGKYTHVTWTVSDYQSYNTNIREVTELMDNVVEWEWDFMGLFKYNKLFANRMYMHIEHNGANPYSASNHTAYTQGYAEIFCNPDRLKARSWVLGHEIGHTNQTRPGFKWTGMTEVSTNVMSMDVQLKLNGVSKLLNDGTYEEATRRIIEAQQPHCLDNASDEFMIKLVPFWQLKLYMIDVLEQDDFYRDLYEHYRVTNDLDTSVTTQGILQLDFVRQVCRLSGYNMLDFFEKWGFLRPVDKTLNDYGNKKFTITQDQINKLKEEINAAGYKTPHDNVHQITDANLGDYK